MSNMMTYAMTHLAQGGCSEHMLWAKLEKEFSNEPNVQQKIEETLFYLKQMDFINDERVAKRIAQRYSHKGDSIIIHHLQQLGIESSYVQDALTSIGPEYRRALKEALCQFVNLASKELKELQNQIMRLLCSRSFSYDTLRQVMDTLNEEVLINFSSGNKSEKINHFLALSPVTN